MIHVLLLQELGMDARHFGQPEELEDARPESHIPVSRLPGGRGRPPSEWGRRIHAALNDTRRLHSIH